MTTYVGPEEIETASLLNNEFNETHDPENDDVIIEITNQDEALSLTSLNRPLPEGKEYHLFFAYSSDDSAFVIQRVKSLESPPHNLRCCFSDRDFLPGKPIHENIEWFMPRCMKIVLVLSPSFYESGWCQMEERLAHAFSATSGLGVIPLVHKPCQIPDSLKTLNYIDESREAEADNKIVEAVFAPAGPSNLLPNWFNPRKDVNGCGVWLPAGEAPCCGYAWSFPTITQADVNVLRDIGANVCLEDLDHVIEVVNDHWALTYYGCLPCSKHACGRGFFLGFLMLAVLQLVLALIFLWARVVIQPQFAVELVLTPGFVLIVVLSCCGSKRLAIRKAERKISRALLEKNRILYRKCKVIVSVRVDPIPKIAVVYYNAQRCKDFIKQLMKDQRGGMNIDQVSDDELDARAGTIMDNLVDKHASSFARWEQIQTANFLRHKTKQDKLCLCQLYEASLT